MHGADPLTGGRHGDRNSRATSLLLGLLALVLVADGVVVLTHSYASALPAAVASAAVPLRVTERVEEPAAVPVRAPARPVAHQPGTLRLTVPALGVDAEALRLATDDDGALEVPDTAQGVGWYTGGPVPGDIGPAVFAGHVDLDGRSGVFSRLATMRPGQQMSVVRPDGGTVTFVVDRVEKYAKNSFPTEAVYGPTDRAQLRLITCGGSFDRLRGSYRDNVVVFASRA